MVNPITVGNFAFFFNCTPVGQTSDSDLKTYLFMRLLGPDALAVVRAVGFLLLRYSVLCAVESLSCLISFLYLDFLF